MDIEDGEEAIHTTFFQRVGDNNKLWVICLVGVVMLSGMLLISAKYQSSRKNEDLYKPPPARLIYGSYGDKAHKEFAADFQKENEGILDAHFVDGGKFIIAVRSDISADDIDYLSRSAAQKNLHDFRNRIVVEVYLRGATMKTDVLAATTKWETSSYGFMVHMIARDR